MTTALAQYAGEADEVLASTPESRVALLCQHTRHHPLLHHLCRIGVHAPGTHFPNICPAAVCCKHLEICLKQIPMVCIHAEKLPLTLTGGQSRHRDCLSRRYGESYQLNIIVDLLYLPRLISLT